MHALLVEVMTRCRVGDGRKSLLLPPHEIAYWLEFADAASKTSFQESLKDVDIIYAIVHAASHFTFLQVDFADLGQIQYKDSIDDDTKECSMLCANKATSLLHWIAPDATIPPRNNTQRQSDSWSCGYWTAFFLEWALWQRVKTHNPNQAASPPRQLKLQRAIDRANAFITTIKEVAAKPGITKEEALKAAESCTKCRINNWGHKGCSQCMGEWFIDQSKRGSNMQEMMKQKAAATQSAAQSSPPSSRGSSSQSSSKSSGSSSSSDSDSSTD